MRFMLSRLEGEVVGEAATGLGALAEVERTQPDVVLWTCRCPT